MKVPVPSLLHFLFSVCEMKQKREYVQRPLQAGQMLFTLENGSWNLESTLTRSQSEIGNVSLSRLICHATFSANH